MELLNKNDNFLEKLTNLEKDENFILQVPKETAAQIELAYYKINAIENLFGSYFNKDLNDASVNTMFKIIEEYTICLAELDKLRLSFLFNALGEKAYFYMKKNDCIKYFYDPNMKNMVITKE